MSTPIEEFKMAWNTMQRLNADVAKSKGWYDSSWTLDRALCLIHREVSEVTEALRVGNPKDEKCPEFSNAEVEFADVVIRIMDLANRLNFDVAGAIVSKMEFNKTRPHKHGKLY